MKLSWLKNRKSVKKTHTETDRECELKYKMYMCVCMRKIERKRARISKTKRPKRTKCTIAHKQHEMRQTEKTSVQTADKRSYTYIKQKFSILPNNKQNTYNTKNIKR